MMRQTKLVIATVFFTLMAFAAITYTSCKKDKCKNVTCLNGGTCSEGNCSCPTGYTGTNCEVKGTSTVHFVNRSFTPMTITMNGVTQTVDTGFHATYVGNYGDTLSGSAFTVGGFGTTVTWTSIKYTFPYAGDSSIALTVPANYFFLEVVNNTDSFTIRQIDVNYGLSDHTTDIYTIPTESTRFVGYYYAHSNTGVMLTSGTRVWTFDSTALALPFTPSQYFRAVVN